MGDTGVKSARAIHHRDDEIDAGFEGSVVFSESFNHHAFGLLDNFDAHQDCR